MDAQRNSKLSLFLMELIVAILFFSLAAAVCVRLFASAHILAEKTESLSSAVMWSQNLAESFCGKNGDLKAIAELFPNAYVTTDENRPSDGILILFFDENWNKIERNLTQASYEGILEVKTLSAKEVYSDVTDYDVPLIGEASIANIAIMDVRGLDEVYSEIPDDQKKIILSTKTDVYLGKEGR